MGYDNGEAVIIAAMKLPELDPNRIAIINSDEFLPDEDRGVEPHNGRFTLAVDEQYIFRITLTEQGGGWTHYYCYISVVLDDISSPATLTIVVSGELEVPGEENPAPLPPGPQEEIWYAYSGPIDIPTVTVHLPIAGNTYPSGKFFSILTESDTPPGREPLGTYAMDAVIYGPGIGPDGEQLEVKYDRNLYNVSYTPPQTGEYTIEGRARSWPLSDPRSGVGTTKITIWVGVQPQYAITLLPAAHTFPSAPAGYGSQTPKQIGVSNSGTSATGTLNISISGPNASAFSVSPNTLPSISVGVGNAFSVWPVTGLAAGTYNATVSVGNANVPTKTVNVSFTVTPSNVLPTSITISPKPVTLNVGGTQPLTADVQPINASNKAVTWTSSNTAVATVNSSGEVTAVAAGTATITARSQAVNTVFDTCLVTVNAPSGVDLVADGLFKIVW